MDLSETYANAVSRKRIGGICQALGWHTIQNSALQVLVDLLGMYIKQIGMRAKNSAEACNRTQINLVDLDFAFRGMGVSVSNMEEYITNFQPSKLDRDPLPSFPAASEMRLNFLRPGSREVLHRKNHIFEYLPPMYPELEMADSPTQGSPRDATVSMEVNTGEPKDTESANQGYVESNPLREIASVMMTPAGFISPAREGKLPESRTPMVAREVLAMKSDNEIIKHPPPPPSKVQNKVEQKETKGDSPKKRNKKLTVFQKKAPKQPVPAPEPPMLDPTESDDIINSVIERGVLESEHLDAKISKKAKKQQEVKEAEMMAKKAEMVAKKAEVVAKKAKEEGKADAKVKQPVKEEKTAGDVKPYFPPNPLISKQLYGFGGVEEKNLEVSDHSKSKASSSKSNKVREKSKKKKAKKSKHLDSERHTKKDKSKKKKKVRQEPPHPSPTLPPSSSPSPSPTPGIKIMVKDPSESTKMILKAMDSKSSRKSSQSSHHSHQQNLSEPQLFEKPFKLDRKSTPTTMTLSPLSVAPLTPSASVTEPKKKRGRPERKEKPSKKRKDRNDSKYEGGGIITTQTIGHYVDADGNKIWVCPSCGKQDDGSPMIGCDGENCDDWYHFLCVGIQQEPESTQNWFCQRCTAKQKINSSKSSKRNKMGKF